MGTWDLTTKQNQFLKYQKSIAEALKQGGNYSTSMYGKWHIGGKVPLTKNGSLNITNIITAGGHDWTQALIGGPQSIGFDNSFIMSEATAFSGMGILLQMCQILFCGERNRTRRQLSHQ